jgi:outer membrane protein assembly factor BamD
MEFFKKLHTPILYVLIVVSIVSCQGGYNRVLKSTDPNMKYDKAMEYYQSKRYKMAAPLFEELISLYRGTTKSEKIYFYYAYCNYYMENYILSGYYFDNFVKTYPNSEFTEEAMFMSGYSDYKSSPVYSLDQEDTDRALVNLNKFLAVYPLSPLKDSCNVLIKGLRAKLEKKAFENAFLYFQIMDYQAALIAFKGVLQDFPESQYKEDVLYWMIVTNYEVAVKSVKNKKQERFETTINSYYKFVDTFPESRKIPQAEKYYKNCVKHLETINS